MDLDGCSLEDAFATDFVGGWSDGSTSGSAGASCTRPETAAVQSRKNERKKAARCREKNSNSAYYKSGMSLLGNSSREDDDDAAVKEIPENSPVHRLKALAEKTIASAGKKAGDFTEDFQDGLTGTLPIIQKMTKKVDSPGTIGVPSYFGADPASDKKKPDLAPFVDYIEEEDTYNFNNADYTKTFGGLGFDKAAGAPLQRKGESLQKRGDFLVPIHEGPSSQLLSEPAQLAWKGKDKGMWSNQFGKSYLVPESTRETEPNMRDVPRQDQRALMEKLNAIYSRLDGLEKGNVETAQTETLLFVMSGLGLIFFIDLACRTACKMK